MNVELICALAARAAEGTVRLVASREETFITHRGRQETDVWMKTGLKKDGTITAVDFKAVMRGGAYSGYGIVTILYAGSLIYGMYDFETARYRGLRVLTNTPPPGAMRGHGTVNARFAFESLLAALADEMGLGKTVQALALIEALKAQSRFPGSALVGCPASLVENRRRETMRARIRGVVPRAASR